MKTTLLFIKETEKRMKKKDLLKAAALFLLVASPLCTQAQKKEKSPYDSYLFAFFSNNTPYGEQIRYAISDDGFNYKALNEGRPFVASDSIARKKGIRDPHIIRAEDGKTFYNSARASRKATSTAGGIVKFSMPVAAVPSSKNTSTARNTA